MNASKLDAALAKCDAIVSRSDASKSVALLSPEELRRLKYDPLTTHVGATSSKKYWHPQYGYFEIP